MLVPVDPSRVDAAVLCPPRSSCLSLASDQLPSLITSQLGPRQLGCRIDAHHSDAHPHPRAATPIAIALITLCRVRRGFLPRGLSNTCPPPWATRAAGDSSGQVSNKPKRLQPVGPERRSHGRGHRPVVHRARAIAARATGPKGTADLQPAGIAVGGRAARRTAALAVCLLALPTHQRHTLP